MQFYLNLRTKADTYFNIGDSNTDVLKESEVRLEKVSCTQVHVQNIRQRTQRELHPTESQILKQQMLLQKTHLHTFCILIISISGMTEPKKLLIYMDIPAGISKIKQYRLRRNHQHTSTFHPCGEEINYCYIRVKVNLLHELYTTQARITILGDQ